MKPKTKRRKILYFLTDDHPIGKDVRYERGGKMKKAVVQLERESRHSSVVERPLGKREVVGPIPPGGTMWPRFWDKVKTGAKCDCWEWQAGTDVMGYGQFKTESYATPKKAHRLAWQHRFGPIPTGLFVCHLCDNTKCCNPDHLMLATNYGNWLDRENKKKVLNGHLFGSTHRRRKQSQVKAFRSV